jgi:hypothetical protein
VAEVVDGEVAVTLADAASLEAMDGAQADGACLPMAEKCNGKDDDCDGETDEDFVVLAPKSGDVFKIGMACDTPFCTGGTIVCADETSLTCGACTACPDPQNCNRAQPKPDAPPVLAPPDAKPSPLKATGQFVDVSAQLSLGKLAIDPGNKQQAPFGASGLAHDLDNDGDLDLVWVDGLQGVWWLEQKAPWQFVAQQVAKLDGGAWSLAILDVDGDGGRDVVVGGKKLAALQRQADGSWQDVAEVRGLVLPPPKKGQNIAQHLLPADLDGDGLLDLLVGTFVCSGQPGLRAFVQQGNGQFAEEGMNLGLYIQTAIWAVMQSDYTEDGLPDLMVFNEACTPGPGMALYARQPMGQFGPLYALKPDKKVFLAPEGPPVAAPMGAAVADVNADGTLDYLISNEELRGYQAGGGVVDPLDPNDIKLKYMRSNFLLLSQPDGTRPDAGLWAGVWAPLSQTKRTMVAWSPAWVDFDHDGFLDLALSHGYDSHEWLLGDEGGMRPVVWRNDGTQRFVDVSKVWGLPEQHAGRSLVTADLDGDGDLDLVLGAQAAAPRVLRNDLKHGGKSLQVKLHGSTSNSWGLGASLVLGTNQRKVVAEHGVGAVSQAMATPTTSFALREGELAEELAITWPSGWQGTLQVPSSGMVQATEPPLVTLSDRFSPKGQLPITVTARQFDAEGKATPASCKIELAPAAQGAWLGPTECVGESCTRTWSGTGVSGSGSSAIVVSCGGTSWRIRPRIRW